MCVTRVIVLRSSHLPPCVPAAPRAHAASLTRGKPTLSNRLLRKHCSKTGPPKRKSVVVAAPPSPFEDDWQLSKELSSLKDKVAAGIKQVSPLLAKGSTLLR